MSAPNDMRVLVGAIRKNGYKVVRAGAGSHQKVLDKKGAVVVDENGPLILSGSPGDHRWRVMHVNRLMKSGVLKSDPWDPRKGDDENGDGPKKSRDEERKEREREQTASRARARSDTAKAATASLRARVEPIVAKLGGWSLRDGGSGISAADFADVLLHYAKTRRVPLPLQSTASHSGSVDAADARRAVTVLRTPSGTLQAKWLPLFTSFVDFLESESGDPPDPTESSLMYLEVLREVKGIAPSPPGEGEEEEREPFSVRDVPGAVLLTPLALEAFYLMARGAGFDDAERHRITAISTEIAALERSK